MAKKEIFKQKAQYELAMQQLGPLANLTGYANMPLLINQTNLAKYNEK